MRRTSGDQHGRLIELIEWIKRTTGMTRAQLAARLDRHPTRIIPDGEPSLDYCRRLAAMLGWSVGQVADHLARTRPNGRKAQAAEFERLYAEARSAHKAGDAARTIALARQAGAAAAAGDERARACVLEAAGHDRRGEFGTVLEIVQRGLRERGIAPEVRRQLLAGLANAHYTLRNLDEALPVAERLVELFEEHPPRTPRDRVAHAHAWYVRGHVHRRLALVEPAAAARHAAQAEEDLAAAAALYRDLADRNGDPSYAAIANTCDVGRLEVRVERGRIGATAAVDEMERRVEALADPDDWPVGEWLESHAWTCVFACNVLARHLSHAPDFERRMGVFTGLAHDVAERLGNWALHERYWSMEHGRRLALRDRHGTPVEDWVIDRQDFRQILGLASRFESFREEGLAILRQAAFID